MFNFKGATQYLLSTLFPKKFKETTCKETIDSSNALALPSKTLFVEYNRLSTLQKELVHVNALSRFRQPFIVQLKNRMNQSLLYSTKHTEPEAHDVNTRPERVYCEADNEGIDGNNNEEADTISDNLESTDDEAPELSENTSENSTVDMDFTSQDGETLNTENTGSPIIDPRDGKNIDYICGIPAEEWWKQRFDSKFEMLTKNILHQLAIQQQQIERIRYQLEQQIRNNKPQHHHQQQQQPVYHHFGQPVDRFYRYNRYQQQAPSQPQQQPRYFYNGNQENFALHNQQPYDINMRQQPIEQFIQLPIQQLIPQPFQQFNQRLNHQPIQRPIGQLDHQLFRQGHRPDIFEPEHLALFSDIHQRESFYNHQQAATRNHDIQLPSLAVQQNDDEPDVLTESENNTAITINLREVMELQESPNNSSDAPLNINQVPSNAITLECLERNLRLGLVATSMFRKEEIEFVKRVEQKIPNHRAKFNFNIDFKGHIICGDRALGDGLNGIVTSGFLRVGSEEKQVALKNMNLNFTNTTYNPFVTEGAIHETTVTIGSDHPNIVKCETAFLKNDMLTLALELMHGSLSGLLFDAQTLGMKLSVGHVLYIAREVLRALVYLKETWGIFHNDIKSANILISEDGQIKLTDFGLARVTGVDADYLSGTAGYMAPEVADDSKTSNESCDIWSFGIFLIELIDFEIPFEHLGLSEKEYLRILTSAKTPPCYKRFNFSNPLRSILLTHILCIDPNRRLTAEQLLILFDDMISSGLLDCCNQQEMANFFRYIDHKKRK